MQTRYFVIILLLPILLVSLANSQTTKVLGTVADSITGEAVPFANIYFKGTSVGVSSGFEGEFSLETNEKIDTLIISAVGYRTEKHFLTRGVFHELYIQLMPTTTSLKTFTVVAGKNPAVPLIKKVIDQKKLNDPYKNLDYYQYEVYNKIQFDANNITESFMERKVLKPFEFVFEYIDTSTLNGKTYLPLFLTETLSDFYFRRSPKTVKEIIKASKVSGIDNESFSQFLGDMYQNVNPYENYIPLFERNFISPVADFAQLFYDYYLIDSLFIGNQWCYKMMFKPKRKQEMTFTGSMWVHDTTFAIKRFDVRIAQDANINFISDLQCYQEFSLINDLFWMKSYEKITIDFNIFEETRSTLGFYGHKTTSYKDFVMNQPLEKSFYAVATNISVDDQSLARTDEFWDRHRHDTLTRDEKTIYYMIDTLKTLPAFNTYIDVINMVVTGYYVNKWYEIGPYASMLSFNPLEGVRLRFGGRTSNDFSKKLMLFSHIAMGTKDGKLKYGAGFLYMLNKLPRRSFSAKYQDDVEQLGQSENAFREDFFFASFLRRNPFNKLSTVRSFDAFYEHEWFPGLINKVSFIHRRLFPNDNITFSYYSNNTLEVAPVIKTSQVHLYTRFAWQERIVMGEFERVSLGSDYPIIEMDFSFGVKDVLESDHHYKKLRIKITDWYNIGTVGWSKFVVEAGKIWGTIPYPLLKLHEGNETFVFDEYSFNTMNYYEFVSDQYLGFYYTHHFNGLFLNKLPVMRKLKWREVAFVQGVMGSLSDDNRSFNHLPDGLNHLSKPFFEAGIGIENIFKLIRVDAIWRLSHLNNPDIIKFGVFVSFMVMF